jgi:Tol biopolymer transport system component
MAGLLPLVPAARLRLAVAFGLVLVAVALVSPAQAAFPGVPGPIAYTKGARTDAGSSGGIFAHGPRRSDASRQLTADTYDTTPSYSANGRLVAFARTDPLARPAASHIYVMNADGSGVRQLTDGDSSDSNPSFSPNGRWMVFDRRRGSHVYSIFVVNLDGSGERQLTHGAHRDQAPVFAPNGRWIAFTSNRDKDARSDQSDIFSMRRDGSRLKVLVDGPHDESDPDISPDGRNVVFASNRDHRTSNIFVARSSGRGVRGLTHAEGTCFGSVCFHSPSWAPDGKHIAYIASSRYRTDLEVMRSDGKRRKEFAGAGFEAEGYGTSVGTPAWGSKPR